MSGLIHYFEFFTFKCNQNISHLIVQPFHYFPRSPHHNWVIYHIMERAFVFTVDVSPCRVLSTIVLQLLMSARVVCYQPSCYNCWCQSVSCVIGHRVTTVDVSPCRVLSAIVLQLLMSVRVLCYQPSCYNCWCQSVSCVIGHCVTTVNVSPCRVLSTILLQLLMSVRVVCYRPSCYNCWCQSVSCIIDHRVPTVFSSLFYLNLCSQWFFFSAVNRWRHLGAEFHRYNHNQRSIFLSFTKLDLMETSFLKGFLFRVLGQESKYFSFNSVSIMPAVVYINSCVILGFQMDALEITVTYRLSHSITTEQRKAND
jgi:hypothetical protein